MVFVLCLEICKYRLSLSFYSFEINSFKDNEKWEKNENFYLNCQLVCITVAISVCVQDFDTYYGNIFPECVMKTCIICKQLSFLKTCQEDATYEKEQEKPCCFFL